jgi:hypothetical protein
MVLNSLNAGVSEAEVDSVMVVPMGTPVAIDMGWSPMIYTVPRYCREGKTLISLVDVKGLGFSIWFLPFLYLSSVIIGTFRLSRPCLTVDAEGTTDNNASVGCFSLAFDPIVLDSQRITHLDS